MDDATLDLLLDHWEQATAALRRAEQRNPYSDAVDDLADEVFGIRIALTHAGVRDIEALASNRAKTARPALLDVG